MVGLRMMLVIPAVLVVAPAALAASAELKVGGHIFYLRTNSSGGTCRTTVLPDEVRLRCEDGAILVAASSVRGCTDLEGRGYCAKDEPGEVDVSGSQLNCLAGQSYVLHSGRREDNACGELNGSKRCTSADGKAYAKATCQSGCDSTGGSGMCCMAGTAGCRFSKEFTH